MENMGQAGLCSWECPAGVVTGNARPVGAFSVADPRCDDQWEHSIGHGLG